MLGKQRVEWSERRRQRKWLMVYGRTEEALRSLRRWTIRLSVAFAINGVVLIPFLEGKFLHKYWQTVGNPLLLLCLCFYVAALFSAGLTYVVWSYLRDNRKIEERDRKGHK